MPNPRVRSVLLSRLSATPHGSSQGEILNELRRCILDGEVPPGSPIPVDGVAASFGVSRIPVREALMTLIGEGLVDHRAHTGYRVATLTAAEFGEIYLVREALETAAMRVAVGLAEARDDAEAQAAHAALTDAVAAGDGRAHHRESRRFHLALIRPCGMQRLLHMLGSAWNMTEPLQPMSHLDGAEWKRLHADHDEMLAAFLGRDADTLIEVGGVHHRRLQSCIARIDISLR
ncbi:GntR family transcriptional regulator [Actinoplanes sp. N902-109]|uniref:GntR family transcriptional regulator n=1 Tax=Actinoplanes sp. (strain N902-109) TaxID=649831 RepID=UPI0003295B51|nr:GntR family transcriptional regulator [Actinoplanes sp. N902-109]AGL14751.1 transcriptional regulator, GntR family [Actinoplanes sp. N902-109]